MPGIDSVTGPVIPGDNYGTRVYTTIDQVLDDPFVTRQLSAPTQAQVGSFLVAGYELGAMAAGGNASMRRLMNMAMGTMMDLMGTLATDAMGSAMGSVPIFGMLMDGLISFVDSKFAEREQRAQEAWAKYYANCRAHVDKFAPIRTAPNAAYKPVDFFSQAYRSGFAADGVTEVFVDNNRIPLIGRMLEIMTETQWPGWLTAKVGLSPEMMGIPREVFKNFSAAPSTLHLAERSAWVQSCGQAPVWPMIDAYKRHWQSLRLAILDQGIVARQMKGRPDGDGGSALWPLYMDLLYSAMRRAQNPWGSPTLEAGFTAVAPLNSSIVRRLYSTGFEYMPKIVGVRRQYGGHRAGARTDTADSFAQCDTDYARSEERGKPQHAWNNWKDPQLVRANWLGEEMCANVADLLLEQIDEMVDDWGNTVYPIYADDQALQAQMLKDTYGAVQTIVASKLVGLGFGGGQVTLTAAAQIEQLAKIGVIGKQTAEEGAAAVSQGAKGGAPVVLAGAALGLGALFFARG